MNKSVVHAYTVKSVNVDCGPLLKCSFVPSEDNMKELGSNDESRWKSCERYSNIHGKRTKVWARCKIMRQTTRRKIM